MGKKFHAALDEMGRLYEAAIGESEKRLLAQNELHAQLVADLKRTHALEVEKLRQELASIKSLLGSVILEGLRH